MTFLCKCINCCCSWCCECCKEVCKFCCYNWFSIASFGCCCCLFGMTIMLLIIYLYYSVYIYQGVSVEPEPSAYQYVHEYPMYKREATYGQEDDYVENYYSYADPGKQRNANGDVMARFKRDNQTSAATPSTPSVTQKRKTSKSAKPGKTSASNKNDTTSGTAESPKESEDELDLKISDTLVKAIHAEAEKANIKEPLGLCRHNEDIKMPEMNITLFPLEQAQEIISCINDLLRNQSKKHLCIELNEEMDAFLKWLLITGESKDRRKHLKVSSYQDDFLFPSTCGASNRYDALPELSGEPEQQAPKAPKNIEPDVSKKMGSDVSKKVESGGSVETTCGPVNMGKASKLERIFGKKSMLKQINE